LPDIYFIQDYRVTEARIIRVKQHLLRSLTHTTNGAKANPQI
jgi:hypothetical protein